MSKKNEAVVAKIGTGIAAVGCLLMLLPFVAIILILIVAAFMG